MDDMSQVDAAVIADATLTSAIEIAEAIGASNE
jgi:hypothetical protein